MDVIYFMYFWVNGGSHWHFPLIQSFEVKPQFVFFFKQPNNQNLPFPFKTVWSSIASLGQSFLFNGNTANNVLTLDHPKSDSILPLDTRPRF